MEEKRFNELLSGISSSLKMKLDHIRKFLYLGQASAMVGAGFSQNAEMDETTCMKVWGQLADDFYEELYRKKPSDNDMRLKSSIKLASQVECTKGRVALDELIIKSLSTCGLYPIRLTTKERRPTGTFSILNRPLASVVVANLLVVSFLTLTTTPGNPTEETLSITCPRITCTYDCANPFLIQHKNKKL